ncbi:hypothetical protein [Hymenobacter coccineus]|uniref:hypothetical protein n=1 Tax=Hymenobacter coccineus TaxID=1908235 RepID=UPI000F777EB5|nr:hypothetical protein [Hymenobacter coccineus]
MPLIPCAQASPAQLTQALLSARQVLRPYYPALTWPQWHQAFKHLQPLLQLDANQATATSEGLTDLARYFEDQHPFSAPLAPLPPASTAAPLGAAAVPLPPQAGQRREKKQTYTFCTDVLESLSRASFWRRESKSALVNRALTQLLERYPESCVPIPAQTSLDLLPLAKRPAVQ